MTVDDVKVQRKNSDLGDHVWRILIVVFGLVILGYVFLTPLAPLDKADLIGYSICHQIPDRSFHMGGHKLPLCARCTGTYLGVAVGFLSLAVLRRWRAGEMLSTGMIMIMVAFIGLMGIDGLNSYLSLWGNLPTLYAPQNWLRATTGSLNGIALSMIVWPIFNFTLWKNPLPIRPLNTVWELLVIVIVAGVVVLIVQSEPGWLLYPVALISTAGILWMLSIVNTMILLILFRRDSLAEHSRDTVIPLLSGLIVTLFELTLMGVFRYWVTGTMAWPL
ncbi:MAG: DUF2085 domain-containing protein [Anaerolineae bacterium]|nr:DUF2085 domain-containing protein [Anaerolineae bacterium]